MYQFWAQALCVGGRGLCLGAGKTRSQKNAPKPRRLHTSGAPRKSGAHFPRKNVTLFRQDVWKSGDFSNKCVIFTVSRLRSEDAVLGVFYGRGLHSVSKEQTVGPPSWIAPVQENKPSPPNLIIPSFELPVLLSQ